MQGDYGGGAFALSELPVAKGPRFRAIRELRTVEASCVLGSL